VTFLCGGQQAGGGEMGDLQHRPGGQQIHDGRDLAPVDRSAELANELFDYLEQVHGRDQRKRSGCELGEIDACLCPEHDVFSIGVVPTESGNAYLCLRAAGTQNKQCSENDDEK
jgi:hypothetical protein